MDANAAAYYRSALFYKLPLKSIERMSGFQCQLGKHYYYFFSTFTPMNNGISSIISTDKNLTTYLLKSNGIPVPKSIEINKEHYSLEKLATAVKHLKFPLVIKPRYWSSLGENVICNIPDLKSLDDECRRLFHYMNDLHIEEFHKGLQSYRALVLNNKIIEVIARESAHVFGNGFDTIERLVDMENKRRAKISDFLKPILFDEEAGYCLKEQNLTPKTVLEKGKKIYINYTSNASRGGTILTASKRMCKENKALILDVARILNLNLVGIDIECQSLMLPIKATGGVILEANHNPSIRIHEEGVGGTSSMVTKKVIRSLIWRHPFSYLYLRLKRVWVPLVIGVSVSIALLAVAIRVT